MGVEEGDGGVVGEIGEGGVQCMDDDRLNGGGGGDGDGRERVALHVVQVEGVKGEGREEVEVGGEGGGGGGQDGGQGRESGRGGGEGGGGVGGGGGGGGNVWVVVPLVIAQVASGGEDEAAGAPVAACEAVADEGGGGDGRERAVMGPEVGRQRPGRASVEGMGGAPCQDAGVVSLGGGRGWSVGDGEGLGAVDGGGGESAVALIQLRCG